MNPLTDKRRDSNSCLCCRKRENQREIFPVTSTFGQRYSLTGCQACGVSYYSLQPAIPELQTFYSTHGYEFNLNGQAARAKRISNDYLRQRPVGKFLDVGCATGFLLDGIKKEVGWNVHGVELVEKAATFARGTLGLTDVLNKDLQQAGKRIPPGHASGHIFSSYGTEQYCSSGRL